MGIGIIFIVIGLPMIFYAALRGYQMYMAQQQYQAIIAERKLLLERGVPPINCHRCRYRKHTSSPDARRRHLYAKFHCGGRPSRKAGIPSRRLCSVWWLYYWVS